jgi:small-conductance mechanosensitive channel
MRLSAVSRALLVAALAIALLLAWRFFHPFSFASVVDRLGGNVRGLWEQPYFSIGSLDVTPAVLVKAFVFVIFTLAAAHTSRRFVRRELGRHTGLDEGRRFAIERGVGYLVGTGLLIVGVQSAGVDLSSLTLLGGAVGLGLGFGLQNIAKNFVSGLVLLFERPIKIGDRIEVGQLAGDVVDIGARATWIRTNDNVVIIVPNSEFIEQRVTNWTANDRSVRIAVPLGVSYRSEPGQVRETMLDVARADPDVLANPAPDVIFRGFGASSLDFELRVWTLKHVQTPGTLASHLYFELFSAFKARGIEIPYPQRDLHLRSGFGPLPTPAPSAEG